ncbi:hypothetical protein LINPERHAP1_LOCUS29496 [Linum perenne]
MAAVAIRSANWARQIKAALERDEVAFGDGVRRRNVILRMDSRAAIALFTNGSATPHQHAKQALEFQELQRRDWRLKIEHTFREGNRTADFLASLGYGYPFGSHNVEMSDSRLGYFLRLDCFGIVVSRLISIND